MVAEVVAELWKVGALYHVRAHGMKVVLGAGHGQEQVDEVVEEEAGKHHKGRAAELAAVGEEGGEHCEEYERIVGKVTHVEQFAPHLLG